ncbi:hypothetical protein BZG36_04394 [Bifiguratus adelaidae]|uniref:Uncharacterized protein n=1 Tax=Bifiguratus adelaidae TaxID=1938954 RepID=A0A261XW28_9FUNG|nr:hypothetical protein BZG36_04394 [Bifiguratus adelaidae]
MVNSSLVQLARANVSNIDNLINASAALQHTEKPYLEGKLQQKIIEEEELPPLEIRLEEAKKKTEMWTERLHDLQSWSFYWFLTKFTCRYQRELDEIHAGIKKSKSFEEDIQEAENAVRERIRKISAEGEKYAVDCRTLDKYRDELAQLTDPIFAGGDFSTNSALKAAAESRRETIKATEKDTLQLRKVIELLAKADSAIMIAIVDLRSASGNGNPGEGRVVFPDEAFEAIKEARNIYPSLPSIPKPEFFHDKPDETGAKYKPMQAFLWDVKNSLADLSKWCHKNIIENLKRSVDEELALGAATDELMKERQRLIKEVILSA